MDQRDRELAKLLVGYSVRLRRGEKILVEVLDDGISLAKEIVYEAYRVGGIPFIRVRDTALLRAWVLGAAPESLSQAASYQMARMQDMQAYIGIRAESNVNELGDIPGTAMQAYQSLFVRPINDIRLPRTKWCVLRYPNIAMAQLSGMSHEAFADFYYKVCCLDYAKMSRAMDALVEAMQKTDRVRIVGPGTDLNFSIKGMPAIKCSGENNIPDGEVFTAPVRDSAEGTITFNAPSVEQGFTFTNVSFVFKEGKIVEAKANDPKRIHELLDTDEGARFLGEFSLGVNPFIEKPMMDTLFDEKIRGSFHLTPGRAYEEANNGNDSAIHWDLVSIQTPAYGGGEIYFDDVLVRRDGLFVGKDLEALNPDKLA